MTTSSSRPFTVYVVDDEDAFRESLVWLLRARGYAVQDFACAEDFLALCDQMLFGCLLVDVRMPGASGLELHDRLRRGGIQLPTLVMSGHADLDTAITAFRTGIVDFLKKPIDDDYLVQRIDACMATEIEKQRRLQRSDALAHRFERLAPREREVLDCILAGMLNKQIASHLGISIKTVEVYRSRVMEKLEAKSLVELVKLAIEGSG